jgi:hypothetical protein
VFENGALRKIFGPKRDEVTGEWRKLHNKELNDLYCSPNIVRMITLRRLRWAGHIARMGDRMGAYRVWWGNRGKETTWETQARWEYNIKMDIQEMECGGMD